MFEAVEIEQKLPKAEYAEAEQELRPRLVNAQFDLQSANFSVLVLISGDDRPGATEVLNHLHAWMDARYIETHAFGERSEAERLRPPFWRYWSALPRRGRIGIFLAGWAEHPLAGRLEDRLDETAYERRLAHFSQFERALVQDGVVVVKYWIHLSKQAHAKRIARARKGKGRNHWRVDEVDWRISERYDEMAPIAEDLLRRTESAEAPWHVVNGVQARHRNVSVARTLLETLETNLVQRSAAVRPASPAPPAPAPEPAAVPGPTVLDAVDLTSTLPYDTYRTRLDELQGRLFTLANECERAGIRTLLVFEGWDAAGKGGVIRRITQALDARDYRVIPISAPTDEELAHHYLWRFWLQVPRAGDMTVFDRSWYGRVLVERVEGIASEREWRRAYPEINDFEDQLVEDGSVLLKFWLHIDPDEQLRRFQARETTAYKKYKITDDDYRNRSHWNDYVCAVHDMVERTSTPAAPWHLVPANDKRFARVSVVETLCRALDGALESRRND